MSHWFPVDFHMASTGWNSMDRQGWFSMDFRRAKLVLPAKRSGSEGLLCVRRPQLQACWMAMGPWKECQGWKSIGNDRPLHLIHVDTVSSGGSVSLFSYTLCLNLACKDHNHHSLPAYRRNPRQITSNRSWQQQPSELKILKLILAKFGLSEATPPKPRLVFWDNYFGHVWTVLVHRWQVICLFVDP